MPRDSRDSDSAVVSSNALMTLLSISSSVAKGALVSVVVPFVTLVVENSTARHRQGFDIRVFFST